MPFITVGSGADLVLTIPTDRTTNWGTNFKNNFATKVAEHDHTASGNGRNITTAAIAADAVNGSKIRLDNLEYLKGRNAADSANINLIQVNGNDKMAVGVDLANLALINDTYIGGRNNADSAYISMIKVNTSDKLNFGADFANMAMINNTYIGGRNNADSAYINMIKVDTNDDLVLGADLTYSKTLTIADNQSSAANVTGVLITATAGNTAIVDYKIYIDATTDLIEKGTLDISYDGTNWDIGQIYRHDNSLVTFSITAGGQLQYTSPAYSGYSDGTMNFNVTKL